MVDDEYTKKKKRLQLEDDDDDDDLDDGMEVEELEEEEVKEDELAGYSDDEKPKKEDDGNNSEENNEEETKQSEQEEEEEVEEVQKPKKLKKKKKKKKNQPTIKRVSGYNVFMKEKAKDIAEKYPNIPRTEVQRRVGETWRNLSDSEKHVFKEKAEALNKEYKEKGIMTKSKKGKKGKSQGQKRARVEDDGQELNAFQKALKRVKPSTRRKGPTKEEQEQSQANIATFLQKMRKALVEDFNSSQQGIPAFKKLEMLKDITTLSNRVELHELLLDEGFLIEIANWLNPSEEGNLPLLQIRETLYHILDVLPITQDYLVESKGLGKLLMRLYQHPKELLRNKKLIQKLVRRWVRPIFKEQVDFRQLEAIESSKTEEMARRKSKLAKSMGMNDWSRQTRRAQIPQQATFDYSIRPKSYKILKTSSKKK